MLYRNFFRLFLGTFLSAVGFFIFSTAQAHAGTLSDFSYTAGSYYTGVTTSYTFSFTTETVVPTASRILYVNFPSGFNVTGVTSGDISVTVGGAPVVVSNFATWSNNLFIGLSTDVAGGSVVTVTANNIVNNASPGTYYFGWAYTSTIGGWVIDEPASIAGLVITTPDVTPPTVSSISSDKAAGAYKAGEVIDIDVTFSENVTSTGAVTVTLETGAVDRTCTFTITNSSTGTCNYTVQAGDTSLDLDATISGTIADQSSNPMVVFTPTTSLANSEALVIDTTAPTVSVLSPVDGATGVQIDSDLVLTFAEPVYAGAGSLILYNIADDVVETFVIATDVSGLSTTEITVDPTSNLGRGTNFYVLIEATAFTDAAGNAFAGISTETDWNFLTISSGAVTYVVSAPSPTLTGATASLLSGNVDVSWSSSSVSFVNLLYSVDGGDFVTLENNVYNTNHYSWALPTTCLGSSVKILVQATDLASILASSETNSVSFGCSEEEVEQTDLIAEESEDSIVEETRREGPSPVDGEIQSIDSIEPGQFIRSYGFSTIYFVDSNGYRLPFWNTLIFFTHAESFDDVTWVSDATLPTLTMGAPVLPAVGTVLVKIQSDPKVYAIDENNTLRWLPTEELAINLYGVNWADYVIDIEPTTFAHFQMGEEMSEADSIDRSILISRETLISRE